MWNVGSYILIYPACNWWCANCWGLLECVCAVDDGCYYWLAVRDEVE